MYQRILVVCVGNICRSPIAEALFQQINEQEALGCHIASAGIAAMKGESAHDHSLKILASRGIDFAAHRAKQITSEMTRQADLILVMETSQKRQLGLMFPESYSKVHRLGEWGKYDILDPFLQDEQAFIQAYHLIDKGVQAWVEKIKWMKSKHV